MEGYTPDIQVTDDCPPLPALANREAAQEIEILGCSVDQVPQATGEWGEKKDPGKGQEGGLSRDSRRSPWGPFSCGVMLRGKKRSWEKPEGRS